MMWGEAPPRRILHSVSTPLLYAPPFAIHPPYKDKCISYLSMVSTTYHLFGHYQVISTAYLVLLFSIFFYIYNQLHWGSHSKNYLRSHNMFSGLLLPCWSRLYCSWPPIGYRSCMFLFRFFSWLVWFLTLRRLASVIIRRSCLAPLPSV